MGEDTIISSNFGGALQYEEEFVEIGKAAKRINAVPERFNEIAEGVAESPGTSYAYGLLLTIEHIDVDLEKIGQDLSIVKKQAGSMLVPPAELEYVSRVRQSLNVINSAFAEMTPQAA